LEGGFTVSKLEQVGALEGGSLPLSYRLPLCSLLVPKVKYPCIDHNLTTIMAIQIPVGTHVKVVKGKSHHLDQTGTLVKYTKTGRISIKFKDGACAFDPKNIVAIAHDDPGIETSSNTSNPQVPSPTRSTSARSTSGVEQDADFVGSSNTAEATFRANARSTSQPPPEPCHSSSSNAAFQIATTPASPCNQRRTGIPRSSFPFVMGKHRIGAIKLLLPDQDNPNSNTIAGYLFGDRLCQVEYKAGASLLKDFRAQEVIEMDGHHFELFAKKVHTEDGRSNQSRLKRPELFYILTQGPELKPIDPKEVIASYFDAESIESPSKAASRMELLLTPAMTVKRKNIKEPLIREITAGQVELLDEKSNEGGGFVPKAFMLEWFGSTSVGQRTTSNQFRMALPEIGLCKGIFTVKDGIDKIQVFPSQIKAGRSRAVNPAACGILLVKRNMPSKNNRYMAQYFAAEKLKDTALEALQNPLSDMIKDVLIDSGVPNHLIKDYETKKIGRARERAQEKNKPSRSIRPKYKNTSKKSKELPEDVYFADSFCLGAPDPTPLGNIPQGYVAIPGLPDNIDSVLVSRSPCMHKEDMLRLPLLKERPPNMSMRDWDSLNARHFGDIYFGHGVVPLPNLIADGDLDGDLYFVMWDTEIVKSVKISNVADLERRARLSKKRATAEQGSTTALRNNPHWFTDLRSAVANVGFEIRVSELISHLYREAKAEFENEAMVYADYVALGNAYKKSLDLKKHGDSVELPEHLWNAIPEDLHIYLTKSLPRE